MLRPHHLFYLFLLAAVAVTAPVARAQTTITAPGNPIVGVGATAGSSSSTLGVAGNGSPNYPGNEGPTNSIDQNITTKYLNFGGTNVGFIVTPSSPLILNTFGFFTANDAAGRDPLRITLEGTNSPNATTTLNSTWSLIYNGPTGLVNQLGRQQSGDVIQFTANTPFQSYRLLVTQTRGDNIMQFGEVFLQNDPAVPIPEPAAVFGVAALALGALARLRRGRQLKNAA